MTNEALLDSKIKESGLTNVFIARKLGISRSSLWRKRKGLVQFNQYEIDGLCKLLNITSLTEKESISFTH